MVAAPNILGVILAVAATTSAFVAPAAHKSSTSTSSTISQRACATQTATYDNLSGKHPTTGFNLQGLHYTGFTIERANHSSTWFDAVSGHAYLALAYPAYGLIKVNKKSGYFHPGFFYIGCSTSGKNGIAKSSDCELNFATPVQGYGGEEDISIALANSDYEGHDLRAGEWGGPSTPFINVTWVGGHKGLVMYLDSVDFSINCV